MGVAGVARRDDGEDALSGQGVDQVVLGIVGRAEVGAQGHVDDVRLVREVPVHVGIESTVHGVDDQVGGALAAEDPQTDQLGPGGGARTDPHLAHLVLGELGVVAPEGLAVLAHTVASGGAGDVRTVTACFAVQRVVVRLCHAGGDPGVVVVTGEVVAPHELLGVVEPRVLGRQVVRRLGLRIGLGGARSAEVCVGVVDARVDDRDLDALAGLTGLGPGVQGGGVHDRARVVAELGDDFGDLHDVGALGELAQLGGIALEGHAPHGVGRGVEHLGAGLGGQGGAGLVHGLADGLDLGGGLDRVLPSGAHACWLRGLEGALALELDEDGYLTLGLLQLGADEVVGVLGVEVIRFGCRGHVHGAGGQHRSQGQRQAQGCSQAGLGGSAATCSCFVIHVSSFDIGGDAVRCITVPPGCAVLQ